MPRPTKTRARERLQRVLDAIADLKQLQRGSPEFDKWHRDTKVAIANTLRNRLPRLKILKTSGIICRRLLWIERLSLNFKKRTSEV